MSKYEATGIEAELQPGGEVGVLRNRLDLITVEDIDDAEAELLEGLYTRVFSQSLQLLTLNTWQKAMLNSFLFIRFVKVMEGYQDCSLT